MNIAVISRHRGTGTGGGGGGGQPVPPYLASIVLNGTVAVIMTHLSTAHGFDQFDQHGIAFAGAPGPFIFRIANSGIGTINPTTGIVTPVAPGSTTMTVETTNSLGQVIVSNTIPVTVTAQVATTAPVSPASVTLTVPNSQQFTAIVYDQDPLPNPMIGATGMWDTTDHSKATSSVNGLVTAVANTTTPISVTFTSGSAVGAAQVAVNAASTVTSVILQYNSVPLAAPYTPSLLLRTGSAYVFPVKDQAGNTLSSAGTYSVTGGTETDFPINATTGSLTPATSAAGKATTITYTHTATGLTASASLTALKPSTPMFADQASNYTGTASGANPWMANIWNGGGVTVNPTYSSNTPTGSSNARYQGADSGGRVNQITIDNSAPRLFMGNPVWNMAFVPSGNYCAISATVPAFTGKRGWFLTIERFDVGFNMIGTGGAGTGAFAYKNAPWFLWQGYSGRCGVEWTAGTATGGDIDANPAVQNGGTVIGGAQPIKIGSLTTEFTGGQYFLAITLVEDRAGTLVSTRYWRKPLGTAIGNPLSASPVINGIVEGPMTSLTLATPSLQPLTKPMGANLNQGIPSGQEYDKQIGYWEVVDGTVYGDPYGLFPNEPTATLTGITGGTVQPGDLSKTVTLTGTNFTVNSEPRFSQAGVKVQKITLTSATTLTVLVSLDPSVPANIGTVLVYNAMTQLSTTTQVFTVGSVTIPGAPTASNATVANNLTLTFPVTLNASGSLPDVLAWQYRVTGGGAFTAGTDLVLTNPSLSQSFNQDVTLPTASTAYDVQFAEKNSAGTSAFSSTVTGTTGVASSGLITAGLVLRLKGDAGTDVTTNGAGVGSWIDQSPTNATIFQGTSAKKPLLETGLYNGHSALRCVSANSSNITANATIAAINTANTTIFIVAKSLVDNNTTNGRIVFNLDATNKQGWLCKMLSGGNTVQFQWGTASQIVTVSTAMTVASGLHIITAVFNGTTVTPYFDGIAGTAVSSNYTAATAAPPFLSVGSNAGSANFFDGDVADILIYNTAFTAAQVAQNISVLKPQYGTP